jgi:hypothetical protein
MNSIIEFIDSYFVSRSDICNDVKPS